MGDRQDPGRIDKIHIMNPIQFTNIRRNEVSVKILASDLRSAAQESAKPLGIATSDSIQQRAAMILKDVRYIIDAHFELTDKAAPGDNAGKFQDMARRRMEKGQCYHQPCFGTREFPANFRPCRERPPCPDDLKGEKDLGWMLLDMDFSDPADIRPVFYRAVMRDGIIEVPDPRSKEARE